jgi:hypothetical protein
MCMEALFIEVKRMARIITRDRDKLSRHRDTDRPNIVKTIDTIYKRKFIN